MPHIAVVVSGCGHLDGAEIRETVLSLLYLDAAGARVSLFAPDIPQADVKNHHTAADSNGARNALEESARIARGDIQPLTAADASAIDALVIPGGFGVAKTLSNFAQKGAACEVYEPFAALVQACYRQRKPIVAICIAPAIVMAALKGIATPTLTIGADAGVAGIITSLGGVHTVCGATACVTDVEHRLITTPAYMTNAPLREIAQGIEAAITALMQQL